MQLLSTIYFKGLRGGVVYKDRQFDDSRLALNVVQIAIENGACVLNYAKVIDLLKDNNGKLVGVKIKIDEEEQAMELKAKAIINATGV